MSTKNKIVEIPYWKKSKEAKRKRQITSVGRSYGPILKNLLKNLKNDIDFTIYFFIILERRLGKEYIIDFFPEIPRDKILASLKYLEDEEFITIKNNLVTRNNIEKINKKKKWDSLWVPSKRNFIEVTELSCSFLGIECIFNLKTDILWRNFLMEELWDNDKTLYSAA